MTISHFSENDFLNKLTGITEANLENEQFGVSELAREMGISRSHIHRRLKALTNQSISQFICTVRLEKAMEMLRNNVASASEIAYKVGFSSPAYFSRCFHNHYGFPPGEVKKRIFENDLEENEVTEVSNNESGEFKAYIKKSTVRSKKISRRKVFIFSAMVVVVVALGFYLGFVKHYFSPYKVGKQDKKLSIIVLPFIRLNDNPNNQYFADGIREDILNNLYWITSLRVISRTSSDRFRGSNLSVREIARKMDVRYVLEGSVRKDNEKTRLSVQLIDAYRDDHLWSSYFDIEQNDIIGVQDKIALQIASKMKAALSENEIKQIEKIPTRNPRAYDHYLQARFLLHQANSIQRSGFDKQSVRNCIKYYEKAIAGDENFAAAYAGLANAWFTLSAWGWLPVNEGFPKARELSMKALEIDPECAEAHAVLGTFLVWGMRNFEQGGRQLKKSVQLNPNFSTVRQWYAQFLMITGPIRDARTQINYALEFEPYFWVTQNLNAWIYYFEEKYDKALETCKAAYDLKPGFNDNEWLFVLNYAKLGEGEQMVQELQKIAEKYAGTDKYAGEIRDAYDQSGINGLFAWLIEVNKNKPVPVQGMNGHPYYIAWWNAIIGNTDESVYWLEKTVEAPHKPYHYVNLIATNPDFFILHNDPRFIKVVDDLGLGPYFPQGKE